MPFAKKAHQSSSSSSIPARSIFVGRTNELLFFVQRVLKPEEPVHNILSIWGQGGVGKTTLLQQFKNQAATADFKAYCLTALVDERQTTPANLMEKLADQLHLGKLFEKALQRYKEALQFLPLSNSSSSLQSRMVTRVPDLAGAVVEGVPMAGPLLREGVKATAEHLLDLHQPTKEHAGAVKLNDPLETLTQVFITELNHLAATKITLPSTRTKRERRVLLFLDTFEQVADEVVPWLLYSMLPLEINPNIVFIIAGRDPLERSTESGPKPWLPYYESHTLHALPVQPFTQEETCAYLAERGITGSERIETIWQLSHGLPLYLGLLASDSRESIDPTKDVVDNFLHRIPNSELTKRQLALDAALFSRPFNLDDLEAFPYLSDEDRPTLYAWLLRQPFTRASSLSGRYIYHDLAQEFFQRYLFQHSPKTYYATRGALATYYQRQLEYLQTVQEKNTYYPSDERVEVILALASQRIFLPDEESHFQALLPFTGIWEHEDIEQWQTILRMLRKTVEVLSHLQGDSHAHQFAQALLRCHEVWPSSWDQTHKQEWLEACDQAFKLFEHTSSPEILVIHYGLRGWGYIRFREYQQALTWFERALECHPRVAFVYSGLGYAHYCLKEYRQALEHVNHGLEIAPLHPLLYVWRAKAYGRLKAYPQALSDLDHAIRLDGSFLGAYNQRGRIYLELKEYCKALADWDQCLERAPEHPRTGYIQFQRGCAYLWLKNLTQATTCFTCSYDLVSTQIFFSWTQGAVLWARAWSLMCQAAPDSHILHHLEAIAGGGHYTGYVCRGVIFFLQKEFQQALTALQHATTLHYEMEWSPGDPWTDFWREWDAHFWLAMVYIALDQEEEARVAVEQALAFEMPPILLKPLCWFEQEKPKLYEQLVRPLFDTYDV